MTECPSLRRRCGGQPRTPSKTCDATLIKLTYDPPWPRISRRERCYPQEISSAYQKSKAVSSTAQAIVIAALNVNPIVTSAEEPDEPDDDSPDDIGRRTNVVQSTVFRISTHPLTTSSR